MIREIHEIPANARNERSFLLELHSDLLSLSLSLSRSLSLGDSDRDVGLVDAGINRKRDGEGKLKRDFQGRKFQMSFKIQPLQLSSCLGIYTLFYKSQQRDTTPRKGAEGDQYSLLLMAALMDDRGPWLEREREKLICISFILLSQKSV